MAHSGGFAGMTSATKPPRPPAPQSAPVFTAETVAATGLPPKYHVAIQLRMHHKDASRPRGWGGTDASAEPTFDALASEPGALVHRGDLYQARTYSFLYGDGNDDGNGDDSCCGGGGRGCGRTGDARASVEAVTVLFTQGGRPQHVFFFAHADRQGVWVPWERCIRTRSDALVVYAAQRSHACYPWPGRYTRALGLANDRCSADGAWLQLTTRDARDVQLDGEAVATTKPRVPPAESVTPWQRFALPCYPSLR